MKKFKNYKKKHKNMEKEFDYAVKLNNQIAAIFEQDSENYINIDELKDDKNATAFVHALANVMPTYIYNRITGDDKNPLQFNHIANQLVFQFAKSGQ